MTTYRCSSDNFTEISVLRKNITFVLLLVYQPHFELFSLIFSTQKCRQPFLDFLVEANFRGFSEFFLVYFELEPFDSNGAFKDVTDLG